MLHLSLHDTSSTIEFVNELISAAFKQNASDIHVEPGRNKMRIRFRIDGILSDVHYSDMHLFNALISHLKIRADLDIAEKRLPQDGRILFNLSPGESVDCRLSCVPTLYGEKIVIRLLPINNKILSIGQLGMTTRQQTFFIDALAKPQGLILITGPTGCGKTTTLYAGLAHCNATERNIYTIEDPIEITLPKINQVNVNYKIGFDFKRALKALLRQDPDVIMVGEIRNSETANLVIQAAQTGHLVLTTLHTRNALDSLLRLQHMGINRLHLTESLILIIAQRLLRKQCVMCYAKNSTGCRACHQGYQGRIGIFEMLAVNESVKTLLWQHALPQQIVHATNMLTLKQHALMYIKQGLTCHAEINRVLND